ncbi:D-2-hydroxyacid dehydrogenase [Vibrio rumoiensis]|uniref:2-ketoacid reductase n=1 Tax=Vibrio rumoiensis 1S-45 TaxID=1188252 RepID=A0A1E5E5T1_9VIBR|nr:D-2-hydroxyacid dehydrogenase [Vibrio rumoiensis]OEF29381.1 2-ketoacid reductase [Vibrio rumoiensis 1S-45]
MTFPPQQQPALLYIKSNQAEVYRQLLQQSSLKTLPITDDKTQATIILADPPLLATQLHEFPKLSWVQSTFTGIDALTEPSLRKDYQLTNVKGIFGQLISEYVLGYSLSYFRHFQQYQQQQQQALWQPHAYQSVANKKMIILGTGSIGAKLAQTASALGFLVIGVNRSGITPKESTFEQCYSIDELDSALSQADIIVNTLPSTQRTRKLINQSHLSHCRDALLFNVGRGDVIDDEGLLVALEHHWVAHAFLDVFAVEPIAATHPYWQHPKVTVTPHIAATSFPEQVFEIFEQNVQRWMNQQPLLNEVNFERGY